MCDYSDDEPSFPDPPRPACDAAEVVPVAPDGSLEEHVFSAAAPGAELHFQVVRLRDQIYAWVGVGAAGERPSHGEMSMALKTRMSDAPSVTTLTRAGEGGGASAGAGGGAGSGRGGIGAVVAADSPSSQTARRLAKRTGACVVASVNIPAEHVDLLAFAERTLAAKLSELGM